MSYSFRWTVEFHILHKTWSYFCMGSLHTPLSMYTFLVFWLIFSWTKKWGVLTGAITVFFQVNRLTPRMFSENRSDSKVTENKFLNNKVFVRKFPGAFGGFYFTGKPCHRTSSKCLSMGLFPRNSLLNQSQEKVSCLSFSYMFQKGNFKNKFE